MNGVVESSTCMLPAASRYDTTKMIFNDNDYSPRLSGFEVQEPNGEWRRAELLTHTNSRTVVLWYGGNEYEGIDAGYTLQCDEHRDDITMPRLFDGDDITMPRLFDGDGSLIRIRLACSTPGTEQIPTHGPQTYVPRVLKLTLGDDEASDEEGGAVSQYERIRQANINANKLQLSKLGLAFHTVSDKTAHASNGSPYNNGANLLQRKRTAASLPVHKRQRTTSLSSRSSPRHKVICDGCFKLKQPPTYGHECTRQIVLHALPHSRLWGHQVIGMRCPRCITWSPSSYLYLMLARHLAPSYCTRISASP